MQGQVNIGGECFDNVVITLGKSAINPQKKQYLGDILLIDGAFNLKTENLEKTKLLEKWLFSSLKQEKKEDDIKDAEKRENKNKKLKITYASGVDESVMSTTIENIFYEILDNANINRTMIITSTKRSAEGQAKAMINNIKSEGVKAMKTLYGSKGDKVIDYYETIKNDYTESQIIPLLENKMIEVGFVSANMDWLTKGAVDFGEASNGFDGTYSGDISSIVSDAKKNSSVNPNQVLSPSAKGEKALHIEIKL